MEAAPSGAMPLEDVLVILRCWHNGRRLILFHVGDDSGEVVIFAFGTGVIEELTPDFLRVESHGQQSGCTVLLRRADWLALSDRQNAPEELPKNYLQERYDPNLTVAFGRTRCVLRTLRAAGAEGTHGTS